MGALIKQYPRYFFALMVLLISNTIFYFWWDRHKSERETNTLNIDLATIEKATEATLASQRTLESITPTRPTQTLSVDLAAAPTRYFLYGNSLYDGVEGTEVARHVFEGDMPEEVFYYAPNKTIIGSFGNKLVCYDTHGNQVDKLEPSWPCYIADDLHSVAYIKDGNVWIADIDLNNFSFENRRQVTLDGKFDTVVSLVMHYNTSHIYVVALDKFYRVNVKSGHVATTDFSYLQAIDGFSPSKRHTIIADPDYIKLVDFEEGFRINLCRSAGALNVAWLTEGKVLYLVGNQLLFRYDLATFQDRNQFTFKHKCSRFGPSSPTGKYIVYFGGDSEDPNEIGILDVEAKQSYQVDSNVSQIEWINDEQYIYSRISGDKSLSGVWIAAPGVIPKHVDSSALKQNYGGGNLIKLDDSASLVLSTENGLSLVKNGISKPITQLKDQKAIIHFKEPRLLKFRPLAP